MSNKYWTVEEVLKGVVELPRSKRGTFPRFTVICDGDRFEIRTLAKLQQILQCTYASQPKVFVNAGKGLTIDFDFNR